MKPFNIYMTGVGGQGIGLLSQTLLRGIDHAGIQAIAVDTHGLAQRGGVVVSRIRCGDKVHSPLMMHQSADLVLGMEIHEALRGMENAIQTGGTLVYLDVSWQPLSVRLNEADEITVEEVQAASQLLGVDAIKVETGSLPDARMQNVALLGALARHQCVPGVGKKEFTAALTDLLDGSMLETNLAVFNQYAG